MSLAFGAINTFQCKNGREALSMFSRKRSKEFYSPMTRTEIIDKGQKEVMYALEVGKMARKAYVTAIQQKAVSWPNDTLYPKEEKQEIKVMREDAELLILAASHF